MKADQTPRLAVGTAQWGMEYGIANRAGVPSDAELTRLLTAAVELGVDMLDTARAYGRAETRIGAALRASGRANAFRIVTKSAPDLLDAAAGCQSATERLRGSIGRSASLLAPASIDTLLLHRGDHRTVFQGALWRELLEMRESGLLPRIGVSAASPGEAAQALEDPDVDVIQVAGSLLDQRLARSGFFERARERAVEVHLRSAYLQGVAFLTADGLPPHLAVCAGAMQRVEEYATAHDMLPFEIWLEYARSLPVARIVVGVETAQQLRRNAQRFASPVACDVLNLAASVPALPEAALDPSRWPG